MSNTNESIDKILTSLDGIEKARLPDSFYNELERRLEQQEKQEMTFSIFLKAAAAILIIFNLSLFVQSTDINFEKSSSGVFYEDYFEEGHSLDYTIVNFESDEVK